MRRGEVRGVKGDEVRRGEGRGGEVRLVEVR